MPTQSQYCLLTPHRTMAERYHKIGSNNSTLVLPFLFPSVHSAFETISVSLGNDSPVVEFERHRKMGHQLASGWHRLKWRSQRPKPLLRRHTVTVRYLPLYQILPLVWPSSCARRPASDRATSGIPTGLPILASGNRGRSRTPPEDQPSLTLCLGRRFRFNSLRA